MPKEIPPQAKTRVIPTNDMWDKQHPLVQCLGSLDELLVGIGAAIHSLESEVALEAATGNERKWLAACQGQVLMTKVAIQGAVADEEYVEFDEHLLDNLDSAIKHYSQHPVGDEFFIPQGPAIEVFRAWQLCRSAERQFWAVWSYFKQSRKVRLPDLPGRYLDKMADALRAIGLTITKQRKSDSQKLEPWRPQLTIKSKTSRLIKPKAQVNHPRLRSGAVRMHTVPTKGRCPECQEQATEDDVDQDFIITQPVPTTMKGKAEITKQDLRNITYKCPHCGHGWGDQYAVDEDGMPLELQSEPS